MYAPVTTMDAALQLEPARHRTSNHTSRDEQLESTHVSVSVPPSVPEAAVATGELHDDDV